MFYILHSREQRHSVVVTAVYNLNGDIEDKCFMCFLLESSILV